jgi:hypothetical protein
MRSQIAALGLLALVGCSGTTSPTSLQDNRFVTVDGQLTMVVSDFPAMMGVLWIAPTAEGAHQAVTAKAIRYGSMCATDVAGRADVVGNRVTLHVTYTARTSLCTKEVRALRYDASIGSLAAGQYEVHILHKEEDSSAESEVRVQTVTVT